MFTTEKVTAKNELCSQEVCSPASTVFLAMKHFLGDVAARVVDTSAATDHIVVGIYKSGGRRLSCGDD